MNENESIEIESIEIKYEEFRSSLHGNGIKCINKILKNEIILIEKPLYCMQTLTNKQDVIICSYCYRFIDNIQLQKDILTHKITRQDLINHLNEYNNIKLSIHSCRLNCGEFYCCNECEDQHWNKSHKITCTGSINENDIETNDLIKYKMFAIQNNEIFLLCLDVYSSVLISIDNYLINGLSNDEAVNKALSPLNGYVNNLWWNVAIAPKGTNQRILNRTLQRLVREAYLLLSNLLSIKNKELSDVLSEEYLSRLIGLFEQNNVGIRLQNPIYNELKSINDPLDIKLYSELVDEISSKLEDEGCCDDDNEDEWEDVNEEDNSNEIKIDDSTNSNNDINTVDELIEYIENHGGIDNIFPPLDGTAFYNQICKINHSCDPNVIVRYNLSDSLGLFAYVIALKDIQPNEELLQSYIDNTMSYSDRQLALLDYGFTCTCSKCIIENI